MVTQSPQNNGLEFTAPGIIQVSAEALGLARKFSDAIGGSYVATFDWAESMGIRRKGSAIFEDLACLTLSAYKTDEVPSASIHRAGQLRYAVKIPAEIWKKSARRLIELDESLHFKLALR
jgi:hypothetical protein